MRNLNYWRQVHKPGTTLRALCRSLATLVVALSTVPLLTACDGNEPAQPELVFNEMNYSHFDKFPIPQTYITLPASGGRIELPIESNYDWHLIGNVPAWLTFEQLDGKPNQPLVINVQANASGARKCDLLLGSATIRLSITFEQQRNVAAHPSATTDSYYVYSGLGAKKKVDFYFTLSHADLVYRAGVEVNGTQYNLPNFHEGFNTITLEFNTLSVNGYTYRAYCVESGTVQTYYGTKKTIQQ